MTKLYQHTFKALGGPNQVQLFADSEAIAKQLFQEVQSEVARIEKKFSRYRTDSVISQINAAAGISKIEVDEETAGLLNYANTCYIESEGLFDITSGVLRKVWNFSESKLPTQSNIDKILSLIGWEKVIWNPPFIKLPYQGCEIDFGGIGKEYAVDSCAKIFMQAGVESGFVNFAGDICAIGSKPDDTPWKIGIQAPNDPTGTIATLELHSGALASSGQYERYMEVQGKRYCHILNPKTGWPVSDLEAVTIFSESCLVAGSIATMTMLLGEIEGTQYLKDNNIQHLIVNSDGNIKAFPDRLVSKAA